jgi:hypothetical protein
MGWKVVSNHLAGGRFCSRVMELSQNYKKVVAAWHDTRLFKMVNLIGTGDRSWGLGVLSKGSPLLQPGPYSTLFYIFVLEIQSC